MVSTVVMLTSCAQQHLLFNGFFRHRRAFQLFMDLDVLANFFLGLFILFAHTLGFASGLGQGDDAKGYDHCPADFDDGVHFFTNPKILACMALAKSGCGKFQPTNAPTAIQNMVSNMVSLL